MHYVLALKVDRAQVLQQATQRPILMKLTHAGQSAVDRELGSEELGCWHVDDAEGSKDDDA